MVLVGRIVRPQGNRGEVVVAPETDFAEARFAPGQSVWCRPAADARTLTVTTLRMHDGRAIVGFEGVASISDAEALRGVELRVDESALPALAPGQFWRHDLVGCAVVTDTGQPVGPVVRIDDGAGAPMLVVDGGAAGEILVPMVAAICRAVDIASKRITVTPVPGLLDLNVTGRSDGR